MPSKKVSSLSFLFGLFRSLGKRDEKADSNLLRSSTPFSYYYDKRLPFFAPQHFHKNEAMGRKLLSTCNILCMILSTYNIL